MYNAGRAKMTRIVAKHRNTGQKPRRYDGPKEHLDEQGRLKFTFCFI